MGFFYQLHFNKEKRDKRYSAAGNTLLSPTVMPEIIKVYAVVGYDETSGIWRHG